MWLDLVWLTRQAAPHLSLHPPNINDRQLGEFEAAETIAKTSKRSPYLR